MPSPYTILIGTGVMKQPVDLQAWGMGTKPHWLPEVVIVSRQREVKKNMLGSSETDTERSVLAFTLEKIGA